MLHNRKALAWLMAALLVLAGCSSTPRVVETKPNPTAVSPEIRAQIEANPEFQLVARLAAQEGKYLNWSDSRLSKDSSHGTLVYIPLLLAQDRVQLVVVNYSENNINITVTSGDIINNEEMILRTVDFDRNVVAMVRITSELSAFSSTSVKMYEIGSINNQAQSLDELFRPVGSKKVNLDEVSQQQRPCGREEALVAAASAAYAAAQAAVGSACGWGALFWTPQCWIAIGVLASASIYLGVALGDLRNCYARNG